MMVVSKSELVAVINLCWQAVNESTLGPITLGPQQVSTVAYEAFRILLGRLVPNVNAPIVSSITEPREPWQQGEDDGPDDSTH